ncbi:MAG: hypothetical protein IPJ58_13200 [Ardenticatenia bacterium]|nr:hypothetical protein [Ardenticatenia bacterium]
MSLPVTVIDGNVGTTTAGPTTGEFFRAGTPESGVLSASTPRPAISCRGYRFTACSLGATTDNTPVPTAQDPSDPFTPTPTWTPSPHSHAADQ